MPQTEDSVVDVRGVSGFRPSFVTETCGTDDAGFMFTRYTATVIHADEAGCKRHAEMGFESGRGAALDQLDAMIKKGL